MSNESKSEEFFVTTGLAVGGISALVLISLFQTLIWYCFDDKLAEVTGVPALGEVPWYNVWPLTLFLAGVFGNRPNSERKK